MSGKIGRKRVLKFRDFPTCQRGDVFLVENGHDEKLNLSIINLFPGNQRRMLMHPLFTRVLLSKTSSRLHELKNSVHNTAIPQTTIIIDVLFFIV